MAKGRLMFKGDDKRAAKKKKKSKKKIKESDESREVIVGEAAVAASDERPKEDVPSAAAAAPEAPQIKSGTGKITASGTVVTGHETTFRKELSVGDALLVNGEMRVITMLLSDSSINLSSAFTNGISIPSKFQFIPKPKGLAGKSARASSSRSTKHPMTKYGEMYASTNQLVYREKTETGSYRIKKQDVRDTSRGDLLYMRTKKTSDKFC